MPASIFACIVVDYLVLGIFFLSGQFKHIGLPMPSHIISLVDRSSILYYESDVLVVPRIILHEVFNAHPKAKYAIMSVKLGSSAVNGME